MRHRKKKIKLGKDQEHTRSLLRNLFTSLILEEAIETTIPRAKRLKAVADRLLTKARKEDLSSRRELASWLTTKKAYLKLYRELLPRLHPHTGGHVRIHRIGFRKGDGAELARVEINTKEEKK